MINNNAAVLFDLDGVLIDSPDAHARSWVEVFSPFGINLPLRRLHLDEGRQSIEIAQRICTEYNLDFDAVTLNQMIRKKREIYRKNAPHGMLPAARFAVEGVKASGWLVGMVTGSVEKNVLTALNADEIQLFDTVIKAGDYKQGKPDPEPFLVACRNLDTAPEHCIVVENAPLGITAAKSAGMRVIAITSTLTRDELKHADYIVDDLSTLPALIGNASSVENIRFN